MDRYTLFPTFKKLIPQFLTRNNLFVIYHDNNNLKIVAIIDETLQKNGYKTEIVNIRENYNFNTLPTNNNTACLVTMPENTLNLIKRLTTAKINKVWIEPGSESTEAINFCKDHKINAVYYHSLVKEIINLIETSY